ncbi:MAG: glycoside hydrolase family 127 protein, partial [Muribaculaceae bacterium]|nr:glycoside hydrolase family 127 protein [Muribaculaceae bacterium]
SLQTHPDPKLEAYIDSVLVIVAGAQAPAGYLYTARSMNPKHPHAWAGSERWVKVEDLSHEFYNLGHMVDAAVAHYQATGKRNFLDIAIRYADCVCRAIGPDEGQLKLVPGHQIAEMALARLYIVTGDEKYLRQAKFFLDMRGYTSRKDAYSQAHKPVVEQDEAVGHAVRAAYMYAGMADVAAITGDSSYIAAIDRIWNNIVGRKLYITGGIGATSKGEAFGADYELPNHSAYCETCAAIGNVYVNHRLFLLHGHARYYDVLERTLYNGLISGMSMDGGRFFYPNPLESHGDHERQAWFGCACCPSNLCRFIPSLPGYIYALRNRSLYVNLFVPGTVSTSIEGKTVKLSQRTGYPDDGNVVVQVDENRAGKFDIKLRIPGWVQNRPLPSDLYVYTDGHTGGYSVKVNGKTIDKAIGSDGYMTLNRNWRKGDRIELVLDMTPRVVRANHRVKADRGRLAVERGPVVYCAEWADNAGHDVLQASISALSDIKEYKGDMPSMLVVDDSLKLIPYYAWNHRGKGNMAVWLHDSDADEAMTVRSIIDKVNSYWQSTQPAEKRAFWDNAAYHTGNMEAYCLTGNEKYREYSERWAEHNQWKGAKGTDRSQWKWTYGEKDDYVLFGDWQICFQTYADLYNIHPDDKRIRRAREVMEYEMSTPRNDYWWWADGLYMVMPVMTKMYKITGNEKYLDKLHEYFMYADSIMYDSEEHLYYRDAKYTWPKHKSANGQKDFWARGDGWVLAGLAKVLADLPADYRHRDLFLTRYMAMADAVVASQQPEGYWTRSMLDAEHAPGPETSGTAFFTYGLLWGINHGYLNDVKYKEAAMRGWQYLRNVALQPDGRIGYVQPIGEKAIPGQVVDAASTASFGVGAFLLAACEYVRYLERGATPDRAYWVDMACKLAYPVLSNMSRGELQKNMQVEVSPTWDG